MKNFLSKLTSRKLWLALAGVITGVAIAFGVDGDTIVTVAGTITSGISAVAYIIAEGKIDAAKVTTTIKAVQDVVEIVNDENS